MSITAYQVTYTGSSNGYVPAVADRRLFNALMPVKNAAGFIKEPSIVVSGLDITLTNGWGMIYGCQFLIDTETVSATATAGNYQLIIRLNVTNSTVELVVQDAATALVQEDINNGGSIYEMAVMTLTTNGSAITEHANVYSVLSTNDDAISALETAVAGKTNTKVKGNAESSYRTGNVNLTPANIGAVPTTRTVNGKALSSNITLNANDIGVTPQNIGAMPAGVGGGDEMAVEQYLSMYWSSFDTGFTTTMITESSSLNRRATVLAYKVSSNTGFALVFNNYQETVDGESKNIIKVFRLSSNQWTKYEFYSDKTT